MSRRRPNLAWLVIPALVLLLACGKDEDVQNVQPGTGGSSGTAGASGSGGASGRGGASGSGGASQDGGLKPCLDRPTDLPRPPSGQLPCELIPPGLTLPGRN